MKILKLALLCSLWISFIGALKAVLFAYTLFLSDAAFASAAPEGNGHVGDTVGLPVCSVMRKSVWVAGLAASVMIAMLLLFEGSLSVAADTQGHPAAAPGTGTARTEAMQ